MDEILKIGKDLPLLKSSVSIENLSPTVNLEGKKGKENICQGQGAIFK